MKFFSVLVLAATAATAMAQTTPAPAGGDASACIAQLAPLLQDPVLKECTTESGLVFPPTAAPTEDVVKKACASKSCGALVAKVKGLGVASCTITGGVDIIGQVLEPIAKECKFDGQAAANGTAPSTPAGNSGSMAGSAAVGGKDDVVAPAAGSKATADASAPAAKGSVPTPTPSKTSGASSVVMAAGAAVAAATAMLL
ncbi:hypothetical protein P43SY_009484 [Pythium insidiosum]|uniref:Elicitin n=1 Tax=Pythium insidiosum TaxID=114742 RepID=A0AAD5LTF2_PYTIN|nr:hypothetical protein P43SY_009484 [Pythium insidiosum]